MTRIVCKLFSTVAQGTKLILPAGQSEKLVLDIVSENLAFDDVCRLPYGVQLPLLEHIRICRASPPMSWPRSAYQLIGRQDLLVQHLTSSEIARMQSCSPPRPPSTDGTHLSPDISGLRFSRDGRLAEVQAILDSSRRCPVRLATLDLTDHDLLKEQQKQLGLLAARTTSLSVGRGLLTLQSERFPFLDGIYPIPALVLDGTTADRTQAQIVADPAILGADFLTWPNFHNGVAAGLRIPPGQAGISKRWILYNIPDLSNAGAASSHAGFLFGLGLNGHLWPLELVKIRDYFRYGEELIDIGLLLGTAATHRGTQKAGINRLLSIHIPALRPPSPPIECPPSVQIAALMGIGLLFQASGHRQMVEMLLKQIHHPPVDDPTFMRESYALAAGLALGCVTLGLGGKLYGIADLHLEDTLLSAINGKLTPDAKPQNSQLVYQGSLAVGDVVIPSSILALGLMYLKTNNASIARHLGLSGLTLATLRSTKPDYVLLRVWAQNLVLWDAIQPTQAFIDSHQAGIEGFFPGLPAHIIAGCSLAIGCRFAGSHNKAAMKLLQTQFNLLLNSQDPDVSNREKCLMAVSLALACVMAGSGNLEIFKMFSGLHERVHKDLTYGSHMATHMALGILFLGGGELTLSTTNEAIAALVIALYPKFPQSPQDNRYHLQAFRHFTALATERRCMVARDSHSGRPCYLPLLVTLRNGDAKTVLSTTAPCILPPFELIDSISTDSPRYWGQTLYMQDPLQRRLIEQGLMFVKRKAGFLSYTEDPAGSRTILARAFPKFAEISSDERRKQNLDDFVSSFVDDPHLKAFVKNFCHADGVQRHSSFFTAALYECLTREKPEVLPVYLSLWAMTQTPVSPAPLDLANFALVRNYYQYYSPKESLIQPLFFSATANYLDQMLLKGKADDVMRGFLLGRFPSLAEESFLLAQLLHTFQVPDRHARQQLTAIPSFPTLSCEVRAALLLPWLQKNFPAAPAATLLFLASYF